jgi:hypothetical protein
MNCNNLTATTAKSRRAKAGGDQWSDLQIINDGIYIERFVISI